MGTRLETIGAQIIVRAILALVTLTPYGGVANVTKRFMSVFDDFIVSRILSKGGGGGFLKLLDFSYKACNKSR